MGLDIDGYTLYRGGLRKGAAIYVNNTLNHSACPRFDNEGFDCSTWIMAKLSNRKNLLVGVVYRSPNLCEANNEKLLAILRLAATVRCVYLMVCGDFNRDLVR